MAPAKRQHQQVLRRERPVPLVLKPKKVDVNALIGNLQHCSLEPLVISESKRAKILSGLSSRGYHLFASRRRGPAFVVKDDALGLVDRFSGRPLAFRATLRHFRGGSRSDDEQERRHTKTQL